MNARLNGDYQRAHLLFGFSRFSGEPRNKIGFVALQVKMGSHIIKEKVNAFLGNVFMVAPLVVKVANRSGKLQR